MESKHGIHAIDQLIVLVLMFSVLSAYMPPGYIGCYDGWALKGIYRRRLSTNTGGKCMKICSDRRYRYAATQHASCFCGNQMKEDFPIARKCYVECPGNRNEICGGLQGEYSFYDIWETTSSTRSQTKTTSTTTVATSTATTASSTTTTATSAAKTRSSTSTTTALSLATSIMVELVPSLSSENASTISSDSVSKRAFQSTGEEDKYQIVLYVSIPVTVAVLGVIAVAIIFVCRRTEKSNQAVYFTNNSRTITEGHIARPLSNDDDSMHIYDQCIGSDDGLPDDNDYLTPVTCTTEIRQENDASMHRKGKADYHGERGETLKHVNNAMYTDMRGAACNENTYEELKLEETADKHVYNSVS